MDIAPPAGLLHINDFDIFLYICIFKCILLTFPVFLKPPVGGEPGEIPSIAACSFNYSSSSSSSLLLFFFFFFFFFFSKLNRILEGLNMLEKSGNFAHASELVKIYVWYGFQSRCGKMARQRHL